MNNILALWFWIAIVRDVLGDFYLLRLYFGGVCLSWVGIAIFSGVLYIV